MKSIRPCSLREMAKKLNVSAPYLSDVEKGFRSCSEEMFIAMSEKGYKADFLAEFSRKKIVRMTRIVP